MALKPARLQWSDDGALASLDYGDIYFQRGQGLEESRYVFMERNELPARFRAIENESFHIAELGFGSGLNFLLTAQLFAQAAPPSARLVYAAIEKHPVRREDLERIYSHFVLPDTDKLLAQYPPLMEGFHHLHFYGGRIRLMLLLGDVAEILPEVRGAFDAWYLDGFSPAKNPAMWQEKLFPLMAERTRPGGTVATFSAAGHVRRGLESAGYTVEKAKGYGVKRDMTIARWTGSKPSPAAKKTIAVLGAGLAGCAAAYALRRRGHNVVLIDRSGIAAETSGNPIGILYPKLTVDPSPLGQFHSHAFCFARQLVEKLKLPSWRNCGVIRLDLDADDAGRTRALLAQNEFPPEFAAAAAYAGHSGMEQAMAGMLSPPEFCAALANDAQTLFGASVTGLRQTPKGWEVLGGGHIIASADTVIVAQGLGSRDFLQTEWLPLQSLRGQVTYLKPTVESRKLDKIVCHDGYITPAVDGLHYIGATFQKENPGAVETRAEDDAENLEKLNRHLPQLSLSAAQVAGSRAGYRATTPDKLPTVGPAPDYDAFRKNFAPLREGKKAATEAPAYIEGLYISAGFGAHGLSGAPLAGEMIAAMVSGEPLPVPHSLAEHLLPERFIFRGLKRKKI